MSGSVPGASQGLFQNSKLSSQHLFDLNVIIPISKMRMPRLSCLPQATERDPPKCVCFKSHAADCQLCFSQSVENLGLLTKEVEAQRLRVPCSADWTWVHILSADGEIELGPGGIHTIPIIKVLHPGVLSFFLTLLSYPPGQQLPSIFLS